MDKDFMEFTLQGISNLQKEQGNFNANTTMLLEKLIAQVELSNFLAISANPLVPEEEREHGIAKVMEYIASKKAEEDAKNMFR